MRTIVEKIEGEDCIEIILSGLEMDLLDDGRCISKSIILDDIERKKVSIGIKKEKKGEGYAS